MHFEIWGRSSLTAAVISVWFKKVKIVITSSTGLFSFLIKITFEM